MPTGPERTTAISETERHCNDEHTTASASEAPTPSRRQTLAAVGSLSLGLTAGCLDSVRYLGQTRVPVEPEDPEDDPKATPGEFHFLLEENDITVDELYHDTEANDLILFYESDAENRTETDNEIALIYRVFRDGLVARGSDINHLYTEVVNPYEGQTHGWGVNADWAREHKNGEISDLDLWNAIINTKVYAEGESPYNQTDADETEEPDDIEDGGDEGDADDANDETDGTDDHDDGTAGESDEE